MKYIRVLLNIAIWIDLFDFYSKTDLFYWLTKKQNSGYKFNFINNIVSGNNINYLNELILVFFIIYGLLIITDIILLFVRGGKKND